MIESVSNLNSIGEPIASSNDQLKLFQEWFRGSKFVDSKKRPLVLYHGTGSDISKFKAPYGGIYLAIDPATSEQYASQAGIDAKVYFLYVRAKKIFSKETPNYKSVLKRIERDYDNKTDYCDPDDGEYIPLEEWFSNGYLFKLGRKVQNEVMECLSAEGYDAVRYTDSSAMTGDSESIVVFDGDNIKNIKEFNE
jgi:hypothetical protein